VRRRPYEGFNAQPSEKILSGMGKRKEKLAMNFVGVLQSTQDAGKTVRKKKK
jgi:hypothetical protein